ncbi:sugar phosphate isomerase/epimerase family protein [Halobellus marinus]|uniref:sugar phosphate isomerase/epimerase family protein n=1 Tax=Halobellus TaxID=1073986 RepID=UPI0028A64325|nr:sugar phosphate isomerase/epimerase [Halobellus sp. DFY28]
MAQATVESSGSELPQSAIQLHTLRDVDASLPETIRRVADAGFEGVEFAGAFLESNPHAVREALDDAGVTPVAAHVDFTRIEANVEALADRMHHAGCRHAIVPHLSGDHFRTKADVDALALRLEALAGRLDNYGIQLSYHVSREPFLPLLDRFGLATPARLPSPGIVWRLAAEAADRTIRGSARTLDVTAFDRLVTRTEKLTFEVDVGWVAAAGYDPVTVIDHLGDRMPLIHIADVRQTNRLPPVYRSTPPGNGILDLDHVLETARRSDIDWLVYEDDDPETPEAAIEHGGTLFARELDGR